MHVQSMSKALIYPDILGCITSNRVRLEALQYAVGVRPQQVLLNQPFEMILILQSMVSVSMAVRVAIRSATHDHRLMPIEVQSADNMLSLTLEAGEVSVLSIPMVVTEPTPLDTYCPLQVSVRYRLADGWDFVRAQSGGVVPAHLNISPYKLSQLQQVKYEAFLWYQSTEVVSTYVNVGARMLPYLGEPEPMTREVFWSERDWKEEAATILAMRPQTHAYLKTFSTDALAPLLERQISTLFAERGLMLHAPESQVVAQMLTHTLQTDLNTAAPSGAAFWLACQLLTHQPERQGMGAEPLIAQHLIYALLRDGIDTCFAHLQAVTVDGLQRPSVAEQVPLKAEILYWLANGGTPKLRYLYMPLLLGGVFALKAQPAQAESLRRALTTVLIARLRAATLEERPLLAALTGLLQSLVNNS